MIKTQSILSAIKERASKATAGPWRSTQIKGFGAHNYIVSDAPEAAWYTIVAECHNAGGFAGFDFIAHARTDVPLLVAALERAEAHLKQMRDHLGPELGEFLYDSAQADIERILSGESL